MTKLCGLRKLLSTGMMQQFSSPYFAAKALALGCYIVNLPFFPTLQEDEKMSEFIRSGFSEFSNHNKSKQGYN